MVRGALLSSGSGSEIPGEKTPKIHNLVSGQELKKKMFSCFLDYFVAFKDQLEDTPSSALAHQLQIQCSCRKKTIAQVIGNTKHHNPFVNERETNNNHKKKKNLRN